MKTQDTNFNPKMSSEPLEEKPKCTLSDYDLIIMATGWVSKLCESGGTKFEMRIPVDYNHDTDMIFTEVIQRFEKANARISELEKENFDITIQLGKLLMYQHPKELLEKISSLESELKALRGGEGSIRSLGS